MFIRFLFLVSCFSLFFSTHSFAQRKKCQKWIAPVSLAFLSTYSKCQLPVLGDQHVRSFVLQNFNWHTQVDNYLQYAPLAAELTLLSINTQGENSRPKAVGLMLKSGALSGVLVCVLKYTTHTLRPDDSKDNSFPSGHTAMAFTGASLLDLEFGKKYPWVSVAGYTVASSVGAMRIINNRHWMSDVLAGAAIGMLSSRFFYCLHERKQHKQSSRQSAFVPYYSPVHGTGFVWSCKL